MRIIFGVISSVVMIGWVAAYLGLLYLCLSTAAKFFFGAP